MRYNAEKKTVGMYFSTKILEFKMRCHLCSNDIIVTTDPKNAEYVVTRCAPRTCGRVRACVNPRCPRAHGSGARRKVETYTAQDAEVYELPDQKDKDRIAEGAACMPALRTAPSTQMRSRTALCVDVLFRLEKGGEDATKAAAQAPKLVRLEELQERMRDDFALSALARKRNRTARKEAKALDIEAKSKGLKIQLLPQRQEDDAVTTPLAPSYPRSAWDRLRSRSSSRAARGTNAIKWPNASASLPPCSETRMAEPRLVTLARPRPPARPLLSSAGPRDCAGTGEGATQGRPACQGR